MHPFDMSLPDFSMHAGETKNLHIPIYNPSKRQIDATGMTARLAISDYINQDGEPLLVKPCSVSVPPGETLAVLDVTLSPTDTAGLFGKFIYQITAKDADSNVGVMEGRMYISMNIDRAAI